MSHAMKTQQTEYAPIEDSDQPGHLPSLIRVLAVHSVGNYGYNFLHVNSADSDQTELMPRLVWVFSWRTAA